MVSTQKDKSRQARPRQAGAAGQRMAGIDGFRAFAIIAVVLYHLDIVWLPSGHLGVISFLVLTGYLLTSSILRKLREGSFSLINLYLDRIKRIWPPMALMVLVCVALCIGFDHVLLTKARPDILPALGFFENISYILRNVSYFEQIGGPSPFTHLWYLGIDAQFCLLWAPVLLGMCAIVPSRILTRRISFALALFSAAAMAVLYNPDAGITRVYYGTDTRVFAPLIGAWLAFAMPLGKRPGRDVRELLEGKRMQLELAGLLSAAAICAMMVFIPDTSAFLYCGGMLLAALLSAVALAAVALPGGFLASVLSAPPLSWLGSHSLGIYLWHYPLIQLTKAANNTTPWWVGLLVVLASCALAELSHRMFEQALPALMPGAPRSPHSSQTRASERHGMPPQAMLAGLALLAVLSVVDGVGLAIVPEQSAIPEDAINNTGEAADQAKDLSSEAQPQKSADAETKDDTTPVYTEEELNNLPTGNIVLHRSKSEEKLGLYDPVLIGDSVPGDAEEFWNASCPDGLLDSYVGRRPDQAVVVLDDYLAQNVVGHIVVIQAFSNVACTPEELEHMVAACGPDRIVYLVNVRIPGSEEAAINQTIEDCCNAHENVHLIDWHGLSEGHSNWLYEDGEHLTPAGQPIYINMITNAIERDFASMGGTVEAQDASNS